MASRTLVVYYSRSGHTRQLAEQIAGALGADLDPIVDPTNRAGPLGYLRSMYEVLRDRPPKLAPATRDPAAYAMVLIGTPIWGMAPASPVRSYLRRYRDALRSVAFFCTCGGSGGERAFAQMARDCGREPVSTLIVREAELARATGLAGIDRFVADVQTVATAERAPLGVVPPITPVPPTSPR